MSASALWRGLAFVCPRCRGPLAGVPPGLECRGCGGAFPERDGVLHLVAGATGGAPSYDPRLLSALRDLEERHFWFLSRRRVILDAIRRAVPDGGRGGLFDIGSGSGGLLSFLAASGVRIAGACDAHPESLRLVRERLEGPLVLVDEGRRPPLGPGHGLVGMFDVLEHLDDDAETLAALHQALAPGGSLVVTVPAGPSLFCDIDRLAGHRRRYTREGLRRLLEQVGFRVQLLRYFMCLMVPLLLVSRRFGGALWRGGVQQRRRAELRVVPGLNGGLRAALALERAAARLVPLPLGSSLVAVAARSAR